MERTEFLANSAARLEHLARDPGFRNERSQLRAKALLRFLASLEGAQLPQFTFSESRLWRYCHLVLGAASRLMAGGDADSSAVRDAVHMAAETAEYLGLAADTTERSSTRLTASLLYHLAGYEANGICLARQVPIVGTAEDPQGFFFDCISMFLLRQFIKLRTETMGMLAGLRDRELEVARALDEGLADTDAILMLAADTHLLRSLREIAIFGLTGEETRLASSSQEMDRAIELLAGAGDVEKGVTATALAAALTTFHRRSTWERLRVAGRTDNPIWREYLRVMAAGTPGNRDSRSVVEFWPSQIAALDAGLLDAQHGFAIQMPTSAGKTRVSEIAVIDALTRSPGSRCVYVAPFRALAQEIEQSFGRTIGQIGFRVSTVLGSFEVDEFEDYLLRDTEVLITTPEKLDLLFRWQPEYFDKVSLVVLDEGHIVDELQRGPKYELLLTKLRRRTRAQGTRFLFVSAVMPESNARQFAAWLADDRANLITTQWRPARQLLARFTWGGIGKDRGWVRYVNLAEGGQPPFVPGIIQRHQLTDFTPARRKPKNVTFPSPGKKAQTAAELAFRFVDQGRVLVFCAQANYARPTAAAMLEGLRLREQSGLAVPVSLRPNQSCSALELAREWLGNEHILVRSLSRGIGLHYGPLPEVVRQAVEDDFRAGHFQILVCTNTLAQGVNLPISTAIVHSVIRHLPSEDGSSAVRDDLKVRDYWNICGRAGRAGVETEGHILHIVETDGDEALFAVYSDRGNIEPVESRLLAVLRDLVNERITTDELSRLLDADLLSILVEEAVAAPERSHIEEILGTSLVKIQADDMGQDINPLIDGLTSISQQVFNRIPNGETRRIFATTGLCVSSCEELAQSISAARENLAQAIREGDVLRLASMAYSACSTLGEMKTRVVGPPNVEEFLLEWVNGQPISGLRTRYTPPTRRGGDPFEQLSRFIEDLFVYRLPWGFNGYLHIAGHVLGVDPREFPIRVRFLASMTKYGLPDHVACWARSAGIPTRSSAQRLAQGYRADGESDIDFRSFMRWLAALSGEDLRQRFQLRDYEIEWAVARLNRLWAPEDQPTGRNDTTSRILTFDVRGLQYEGRRELAHGIAQGVPLTLQREADNPYDSNAIKVFYGENMIGYVDRLVAKRLARELDLGVQVEARVEGVVIVPTLFGPDRISASATW